MKKLSLLFITFALAFSFAYSQSVGISETLITPDASSLLEVRSNNQGILIPRISLTGATDVATIQNPANSLLIFNTSTAGIDPNDVTPGYYYWDASIPKWVRMGAGDASATEDAWLLEGNTGTNATTNFLGTTDNRHLVFRTDNTEKMRITSGGNVGIGEISPTSKLHVVSTGQNSIYGRFNNNIWGYVGHSNHGVYGKSNHASGTGVFGDGTGGADGVRGHANTENHYGIIGINQHGNGNGIIGINNAASGTGSGVGLAGVSAQRYGPSVAGFSLHTLGTGISGGGNNLNPHYLVARGSGGAFIGTDVGSISWATDVAGGTGIMAAGNNLTAIYFGQGSGGAFVGKNVGVYTVAEESFDGIGIMAAGNNENTYYPPNIGCGGAFTGTSLGVYGRAVSDAAETWGGLFTNGGSGLTWIGGNQGGTIYKVIGNGTASTIVPTPSNERVVMFAPESPEILFKDYGTGQLINGKASIELDPVFTHNIHVDENHPLRVFVQLEGECNGVYVTNKSKTGFDVVELNNGTSNISFSYSVVANRVDWYEDGVLKSKHAGVRFPPAPKILEAVAGESIKAERKNVEPVRIEQELKMND